MTTIYAEEISNNINLLTEILVRLQVKPLVRFKCISKQWLSLISDSQFCVSHTRHHHNHTPSALLLRDNCYPTPAFEKLPLKQDTTPPKIPFFDHFNVPCLSIMQSCNGLLLCNPEHNYHICNPATKQFKSLSYPSSEFKQSLVSVCLAFDPLKSNHCKLICVCTVKDKGKYQIHMYSSETDFWRSLEITFTAPHGMHFSNPVFCNGAVHWYSEDKTLLYFDVDKECLNTMPMPKLTHSKVQYFGESRGHLHLIVTEWRSPVQFDILEMAVDYSEWVVRYQINLDAVKKKFPKIIWYREGRYRFSVLHVVRAQKEEESVVVLFVDSKAIFINAHDGILKKLFDLENDDYTWRDTFQYFEILTYV